MKLVFREGLVDGVEGMANGGRGGPSLRPEWDNDGAGLTVAGVHLAVEGDGVLEVLLETDGVVTLRVSAGLSHMGFDRLEPETTAPHRGDGPP